MTDAPVRGLRCIVLGSTGYLGSHLVKELRERGCSVVEVAHRAGVTCDPVAILDVQDAAAVDAIDWDCDLIFAFAGKTGTLAGFEHYREFTTINELGLLNVLHSMRRQGSQARLIFPSTRLIYAGGTGPLAEDAAKDPRTIYAVNKLASEHLLASYARSFDLTYTVFRIGVPYGNATSDEYSYGLIGALLKQAVAKRSITLFGDGRLRRTFTHVQDFCEATVAGALDPRCVNQIFNLPGEDLSLQDVAELVAARFGASVCHVEWPDADRRIESGDTVFNSSRMTQILGFHPARDFRGWIASLKQE